MRIPASSSSDASKGQQEEKEYEIPWPGQFIVHQHIAARTSPPRRDGLHSIFLDSSIKVVGIKTHALQAGSIKR